MDAIRKLNLDWHPGGPRTRGQEGSFPTTRKALSFGIAGPEHPAMITIGIKRSA